MNEQENKHDNEKTERQFHDLVTLKQMSISRLAQLARGLEITNVGALRKQDLIFRILQSQAEQSGLLFSEGVLEVLPEGYGFLRSPEHHYLPAADDIYVSSAQIRRFELRTGDMVSGQVRLPLAGESSFALVRVEAVNSDVPDEAQGRIFFDNLKPLF